MSGHFWSCFQQKHLALMHESNVQPLGQQPSALPIDLHQKRNVVPGVGFAPTSTPFQGAAFTRLASQAGSNRESKDWSNLRRVIKHNIAGIANSGSRQ
jgi:hypothetical protein